jgi:hypothetical protein
MHFRNRRLARTAVMEIMPFFVFMNSKVPGTKFKDYFLKSLAGKKFFRIQTSGLQRLNYLELEQMYAADFKYALSVNRKTDHLLIPQLPFIPFVQKILMTIRNQSKYTRLQLFIYMNDDSICFSCHVNDVVLSRSGFSKIEQQQQMHYKEVGRLFVTGKDLSRPVRLCPDGNEKCCICPCTACNDVLLPYITGMPAV